MTELDEYAHQIISAQNLIRAYSFELHLFPQSTSFNDQYLENKLLIERMETLMKIGKAKDYLCAKQDQFNEIYTTVCANHELPQFCLNKNQLTPKVAIFYFQETDGPDHDYVISNFLDKTSIPVQLFRFLHPEVTQKVKKYAKEIQFSSNSKSIALNNFWHRAKKLQFEYVVIFPEHTLVAESWLEDLMVIRHHSTIGMISIAPFASQLHFMPLHDADFNLNQHFLIAENNLTNKGVIMIRSNILGQIKKLPTSKKMQGKELQILSYFISSLGFQNVSILRQSYVQLLHRQKEYTCFEPKYYRSYMGKLKRELLKRIVNENNTEIA